MQAFFAPDALASSHHRPCQPSGVRPHRHSQDAPGAEFSRIRSGPLDNVAGALALLAGVRHLSSVASTHRRLDHEPQRGRGSFLIGGVSGEARRLAPLRGLSANPTGDTRIYAEGVTQQSPGLPPLLAATLGNQSRNPSSTPKGLRGTRAIEAAGRNPFRVENLFRRSPQGSRKKTRQPWAMVRNAFGVQSFGPEDVGVDECHGRAHYGQGTRLSSRLRKTPPHASRASA